MPLMDKNSNDSSISENENIYWKYETFLRKKRVKKLNLRLKNFS